MRGRLLVLAVLLAGTGTARAAPAERVRVQLKWAHQFQFAGYYVALEKGYYRDAGLDVELVAATPGMDAVDEVAAGRAHAGVGTSELLIHQAEGADMVVLAQVFQHSPFALAVRTDHGIRHVHDLAGKRVMVEPEAAELRALLMREGLREPGVTFIPHAFDIRPLVDGTVDAATVYVTSEPFALNEAGVTYRLLDARSAGIDFYGDNLFTRRAELRARPLVMAAFREASLHGWREALADLDGSTALVHERWAPGLSVERLRYEAERTRELVRPDVVEVGYQYRGRWEHIGRTYKELGLVRVMPSLAGFLWEDPPGLPAWVAWMLVLMGALGAVAAGVALVVSRAARRAEQEERRLRAFIDASPVPITVVVEATRRFAWANARAQHALGMPDLVGRSVRDVVVDLGAREALLSSLDPHGMARDWEVELRRADGTAFLALVSSKRAPFLGQPAIVSGFVDLTERRRLEADLRTALEEVRTLQGMLPICMHCKRIRDDAGAWRQVEHYVAEHVDVTFSHGVCPECLRTHHAGAGPDDEP